ncbi:MAG: class I SAM-dependent methyltransferase [Alphaproteobacteria bacterium]
MELDGVRTVVELGPGTGSCTQVIREFIGPETLLVAIEINALFTRHLGRKFPDLEVINGSAEDLPLHLKTYERSSADVILSGIPWGSLPYGEQDRLMNGVVSALRPGGRFAAVANAHAVWLRPGRRFRTMLEGHFRQVRRSPVVWKSFPPAFVYHCEK